MKVIWLLGSKKVKTLYRCKKIYNDIRIEGTGRKNGKVNLLRKRGRKEKVKEGRGTEKGKVAGKVLGKWKKK